MIKPATFQWRLVVEREVLTFRDKLGISMTTLGLSSIFFGIIILASWFLTAPELRSQINILRPLVVLFFGGIGLIRLSLFTVKKSPPTPLN